MNGEWSTGGNRDSWETEQVRESWEERLLPGPADVYKGEREREALACSLSNWVNGDAIRRWARRGQVGPGT